MRYDNNEAVRDWLSQFDPADQADAKKLLSRIRLVSADEFLLELRPLVVQVKNLSDSPIGLYVERELPHRKGVPNRLFQEPRRKRKRKATGNGPKPVDPRRKKGPEVGSEGLIAHLITTVCKEHSGTFYSHPGPETIREKKIRHLVLVTDFIGSGDRVRKYLEAFWRVASVRSWKSYGLVKFTIIAHTVTAEGESKVRRHKARPEVLKVRPCPTIETEFRDDEYTEIEALCEKYKPKNVREYGALGYGDAGGLLVFSHGCPNNAPAMLHRKGRRWKPLFPGRVTAQAIPKADQWTTQDSLVVRLSRIGEVRIAKSSYINETSDEGGKMIVVLAACRGGRTNHDRIALASGLTVTEVYAVCIRAWELGWIDECCRLTDSGREQLRGAGKSERRELPLPIGSNEPYYPRTLRGPK